MDSEKFRDIITSLTADEQRELISILDKKEIVKIANRIKRKKTEQKKKELLQRASQLGEIEYKDDDIKVYLGNFEEVLRDVEDNSVDLILTDPPYPKEFLPLFEKLSLFANQKLKPSGYLITYTGQLYLPQVIELLSKHLTYRWSGCLFHNGATRIINGVNVMNRWKSILFFQKKPITKFKKTFSDYFVSEKQEKTEHEWQQSKAVIGQIIDIFTKPKDLVVDPFLGGGTTAAACKNLKRRFIGAEIDETSYKLALARLKDES